MWLWIEDKFYEFFGVIKKDKLFSWCGLFFRKDWEIEILGEWVIIVIRSEIY